MSDNIFAWIGAILAIVCLVLLFENEHLKSNLAKDNTHIQALSTEINSQNAAIQKMQAADELRKKNLSAAVIAAAKLEKISMSKANKILDQHVSSNCQEAILWGAQLGIKLSKWSND